MSFLRMLLFQTERERETERQRDRQRERGRGRREDEKVFKIAFSLSSLCTHLNRSYLQDHYLQIPFASCNVLERRTREMAFGAGATAILDSFREIPPPSPSRHHR